MFLFHQRIVKGFHVYVFGYLMCIFYMFKYLVDERLYESKDDTMRREEVLGRIDQVTQRVSLIIFSVFR